MSEFKLLGDSLKSPLTAEGDVPKDVIDYVNGFKAVINFTGHGSRNQIAEDEIDHLDEQLQKIVTRLNGKHGKGKWLASYGGDPFYAEKPDVAYIMNKINGHGVPIIAICCDKYAPYMVGENGELATGPSYKMLGNGAAVVYKTEVSSDGSILFGGIDKEGKPVGATRYVLKLFGERLREHFAFGGGKIALQEYQLAKTIGLKVSYVRVKARVPTPLEQFEENGITADVAKDHQNYGILDAVVKDNAQSEFCRFL